MKVLHVSDTPLPDARVEKLAYLSKKRDWETCFAGPGFGGFALGNGVFEGLYYVPWNRYARLGVQPYFHWVKWKLSRILSKVKPDVVHAHNVFSAKIVCDLGYPFVFDDHELASLEKKSDVEWEFSSVVDKVAGRYEVWRWGGWEREVSLKAPVITVSKSIAEVYRKLGAEVFVVPNYPSLFELSKVRLSEKRDGVFTAVYLGNDISKSYRPYRNVKGITKVFKELGVRLVVIGDVRLPSEGMIVSKGYIPHLTLYNVMSKYHVGLLPWKKHWFHDYANPNKPYMYAHSGVIVVVTASLKNVIDALKGTCRTIDTYVDLKKLLLEFSQNIEMMMKERQEFKRYAKANLVLENFEGRLVQAYKKA